MAENERLKKEAAAKEGEAAEARDAGQAAEEDAKPSKSEGEGYKQLLVSAHFSCSSSLNLNLIFRHQESRLKEVLSEKEELERTVAELRAERDSALAASPGGEEEEQQQQDNHELSGSPSNDSIGGDSGTGDPLYDERLHHLIKVKERYAEVTKVNEELERRYGRPGCLLQFPSRVKFSISVSSRSRKQISKILSPDCFTVCNFHSLFFAPDFCNFLPAP